MLWGLNHPIPKLKGNLGKESFGVGRLHKKKAGTEAKKDKRAGFPGAHT